MLGFRTEKAQMVVKNGIDHHRTRQILSSCLYALSKELLVPFIRDCQKNGVKPSSKNYSEWIDETCSEQYMLFYHLTFSYLLAFNLYTEATRKNHSIRMMAARVQFAPLFYSFKHPKYQKLHLRDLLERVQMPELLKSYLESHESFSVSNFYNRCQGGDFIQEESNKLVKSFLPPGMPSAEIWRRVCRKSTNLKELKDSLCDTSSNKKIRHKRHLNEVTMMRREVRLNNLVLPNLNPANLISIDGVLLEGDLSNIKYNAAENYENYKKNHSECNNVIWMQYKGTDIYHS